MILNLAVGVLFLAFAGWTLRTGSDYYRNMRRPEWKGRTPWALLWPERFDKPIVRAFAVLEAAIGVFVLSSAFWAY